MEVHLLAIQARIMLAVGFLYLTVGFWLGTDPATLAWRTALAAVIAVIGSGWLLRQCAAVVEERMAVDIAERQLAAEQAAAQATAAESPTDKLKHQLQQHQRVR